MYSKLLFKSEIFSKHLNFKISILILNSIMFAQTLNTNENGLFYNIYMC